MISLIVARTQNHIIGKENQMPWHLPRDLAWFRQNTLPKRPNIILSRSGFAVEGAYSATNLEQAVEIAQRFANVDDANFEVMIIGGGELFKQALPMAKRLYLTEIQAEIVGDTYFEFDEENWQQISSERVEADAQNAYACQFMIFERKKP